MMNHIITTTKASGNNTPKSKTATVRRRSPKGGLLVRDARDTAPAFPKLNGVALYCLLGLLDCHLIIRTHHNLWRSPDMSIGVNTIDAVVGHGLPRLAGCQIVTNGRPPSIEAA